MTDADVALGRIDPHNFAGGTMVLDDEAARAVLTSEVGAALSLDATHAALGVAEMVDENMANAARVHAIESGKTCDGRTLVAFGGAAPLHAARIAEKLDMDRIVIPPGAGVGSAIGFLRAPVAYEVTRSYYQRVSQLEAHGVNVLLEQMRAEAYGVVEAGARGQPLVETRTAYMRYVGQGHEVGVEIPVRVKEATLGDDAGARLLEEFEREYHRLYERTIPDLDVEILTWVLLVSTVLAPASSTEMPADAAPPEPIGERALVDTRQGTTVTAQVYDRDSLEPGARLSGPAVLVEKDTATIVTPVFDAEIHPHGHIVMTRRAEG